IDSEKIKVIYSGVGKQFRPNVIASEAKQSCGKNKIATSSRLNVRTPRNDMTDKYYLPDKFILYFGTIEPRKNLIGLIKAFELLKDKNIKLVIAGTKGWLYQDIFKTASQSKRKKDIIFTGFVKEEDKPYLYNLAQSFVYPSFFEGFGFPPLEAMACGIPTIVSANSSLPEVVGDAALMVNPKNIDELAQAMETVSNDNKVRDQLIKKGLKQALRFSWEKCAQETLKVLTGF
ncbi:MAG: glycosyltransferase family 1 protein, partial [Patescibacteria group bacterium]